MNGRMSEWTDISRRRRMKRKKIVQLESLLCTHRLMFIIIRIKWHFRLIHQNVFKVRGNNTIVVHLEMEMEITM